MDEKGRLKIPSHYRQIIEGKFGREFYVTSLDGSFVRLYPFPVWLEIETKLLSVPSFDPVVSRFREAVTYYGATASMDKQGRLLVQAPLREKSKIVEEVSILGQLNYLDVWNRKKLDERVASRTFTEEDLKVLSDRGF
ncbi:MAG: division/cell wall cluster transcriptional repressor MraZ [Acidobacteria bacterium]|nr:division/cell wall cluster transcriptional repressor MraZ [Acidobacteriota bacterium]